MSIKRVRASVLVAVLALVAVSEARAQEGWSATPTSLSAPVPADGAIFSPKVDVDAAGNALALWTDVGPTSAGTGSVVRAARYDGNTRQWGPPVTLSNGERTAIAEDIAVDGAGNAVAIWRTNVVSTPYAARVARFDAASATWSMVSLSNSGNTASGAVAASPNGHAVACWNSVSGSIGVFCRRFTPSGGWGPVEQAHTFSGALDAAVADTGLVQVLNTFNGGIFSLRFDPGVGTWANIVPASSLNNDVNPELAMNAAGDAVAAFTSRGVGVSVITWPVGATAWTHLPSPGQSMSIPRAVVDADGVITMAALLTSGPVLTRKLLVSRFDGAWTTPIELPGQSAGFAYAPAGMDVDDQGNVHVVWSQSLASPQIRLLAARYAVSTGAWTTATNLSVLDQSAYNPDVAVDGAGNAIAVWFQVAAGSSVPQALRWGATPAAPSIVDVTPSAGGLSIATTVGAAVDPDLAVINIEYSLNDGGSWTPRAPAGADSPTTILGLVDGAPYTLRLRAVNAAGASVATAPLRVRSGTSTAPASLRVAARSGNTITLAWLAPPAGVEPDDYVIEGGLAGTTAVLASIRTGSTAPRVTLTVPAGAFFVRVAALSGTQRLGESLPIDLRVLQGAAAPSSPTQLQGSVSGSTVALSWVNALEGAPPTAIRLLVTGAATATFDVSPTESFTTGGVPPGTYGIAIQALNGAIASAPSAPISVTVPGTCAAPPSPPVAFSAVTQGNLVLLDWLPPNDAAVIGYALHVTGAFNGSVPAAGRSLAIPAPPGTYSIRVTAQGLCATSAPTATHTVVVP